MDPSRSGFQAALLAGWAALTAAGVVYARSKSIPAWAAIPILAAFLIEYPFYLLPAFEGLRDRFERGLPVFLIVSFVTPYVVYAAATGQFRWLALLQLAALATALSLWYVVLPMAPAADAAFLLLVAAVVLRGYFDRIYTAPVAGLPLGILGHLALTHLMAMVMLVKRRVARVGFGFWPSGSEWMTGARQFVYFLIIGIPLAWATHLVHLGHVMALWKIAATFIGILWVVALAEEFLFRGLLQQWMAQWTGSSELALTGTAIIFGLAHLGFRGFPNWRFALAAGVAGWFYGRAFNEGKSIRAGMVTHALLVTAWRALS